MSAKKIMIAISSLFLLVIFSAGKAEVAEAVNCSADKITTVNPTCSIKFTVSKTDPTLISKANVDETKGLWMSVSNYDAGAHTAYYVCENSGEQVLKVLSGVDNMGDTGGDWTFAKAGEERCYIVFFTNGVTPKDDWSNNIGVCQTGYVTVSANSSGPSCTASFSPNSIGAPGTSNLSYSSSGANKLFGFCTGPLPITNTDEWPLIYSYPFPFDTSQTGTETCTLTPYNDSVAGTPCSATVVVNKNNNENCECTTNSAFGGGDPCTGGYCDGCHCNYSNCKPSCSCASTTCTGRTCSNGCGGTCNGTKSCGGGEEGKDIQPLPASSYRSMWQYQMTYQYPEGHKNKLGYKNVNSPYTDVYKDRTSGDFGLSSGVNIMNCDQGGISDVNNVQGCAYSGQDMQTMKIYFPPGSKLNQIGFSKSQGSDSSAIVLMRFGEPPQGSYSSSFIRDGKNGYYRFNEATFDDVKDKDHVRLLSTSGSFTLFSGSLPENHPGGWLYVRIIPYGSTIYLSSYHGLMDFVSYKTWYDNMTTTKQWQSNGDPPEETKDPDCAKSTCVGVSCHDGTAWVYGTKTEGCSGGTASFSSDSITPKQNWTEEHPAEEISYLTWAANEETSRLQVECIVMKDGVVSEIVIERKSNEFIQLTSDIWQEDAKKEGYSSDKKGYPGWLKVGTVGKAVCTFYPTNKSDSLPGTPFSAAIKILSPNNESKCGNNIIDQDQGEECDYILTETTNDPSCASGKVCQNCKCVTKTDDTPICIPDDPGCAEKICKDATCFDGCNKQKGIKECQIGR